jgi:hypothetical protein
MSRSVSRSMASSRSRMTVSTPRPLVPKAIRRRHPWKRRIGNSSQILRFSLPPGSPHPEPDGSQIVQTEEPTSGHPETGAPLIQPARRRILALSLPPAMLEGHYEA